MGLQVIDLETRSQFRPPGRVHRASCHDDPFSRGAKNTKSGSGVQPLRGSTFPRHEHTAMSTHAVVTNKGARRWAAGHPWIYRSDVAERPDAPAGAVLVHDTRGKPLGTALWSPRSEISLRLLERDTSRSIDAGWWRERIGQAVERRAPLRDDATAYRLVHGEGDG